jgi:hypothetical protein
MENRRPWLRTGLLSPSKRRPTARHFAHLGVRARQAGKDPVAPTWTPPPRARARPGPDASRSGLSQPPVKRPVVGADAVWSVPGARSKSLDGGSRPEPRTQLHYLILPIPLSGGRVGGRPDLPAGGDRLRGGRHYVTWWSRRRPRCGVRPPCRPYRTFLGLSRLHPAVHLRLTLSVFGGAEVLERPPHRCLEEASRMSGLSSLQQHSVAAWRQGWAMSRF